MRGPTDSRTVREAPKSNAPATTLADATAFSDEAVARAEASQVFELSASQNDIREERVAEARKNIEEGIYRVSEIVEQVAKSLTQFVA